MHVGLLVKGEASGNTETAAQGCQCTKVQVVLAQVDIQVFSLQRPILRNHILEASAELIEPKPNILVGEHHRSAIGF